jgi:phage-related protein
LWDVKELKWVGRSLDELRSFPQGAKENIGYQLYEVQQGRAPIGSKKMSDVGRGCRELCVASDDSWFRVFYVPSIGDYIWVLHCFQKKTNTTAQADIAIGKKRYRAIEEG